MLNEIKRGKLTLKGKTNDISIFWDIPFGQNMNDIEFSHILEGYDKEWKVGKDKFAKYPALQPGVYQLKLKIGNDKIHGNENITSLQIKILPKIYQTLLFKLLSFLIIIILIPVVIIVIAVKRNRTKKTFNDDYLI